MATLVPAPTQRALRSLIQPDTTKQRGPGPGGHRRDESDTVLPSGISQASRHGELQAHTHPPNAQSSDTGGEPTGARWGSRLQLLSMH